MAGYLAVPLVIFDPSHRIIYYNEMAEIILGRRFDGADPIPWPRWSQAFAFLPDHEPALGSDLASRAAEWVSGYTLARDADLLIHDAQYSSEEYPDHVGWGHSSMRQAFEFAALSRVSVLAPFHHDPSHTDDDVDRIVGDTLRDVHPRFAVAPAKEQDTLMAGRCP